MNLNHRLAAIVGVMATLAGASGVHAGLISGVTGSSQNGGAPNTVFTINTTTGVVTTIGVTSATPNSLAFNPQNQLYYYGDHDSDDFYFFDPVTGTDTKIADATAFGAPPGSRFSGPGEYYRGRYYYVAEGSFGFPIAGENTIRWFEFSPNGQSVVNSGAISVSLPSSVSGFGDLGDFAIHPTTGLLYAGMSNNDFLTNEMTGIVRINILDPTPAATILNPNEGLDGKGIQLAFDGSNVLWADRFDTMAQILPVNLSTGVLGANVPLTNLAADFFDLATGGYVPEPGALVLVAMALMGIGSRRTR